MTTHYETGLTSDPLTGRRHFGASDMDKKPKDFKRDLGMDKYGNTGTTWNKYGKYDKYGMGMNKYGMGTKWNKNDKYGKYDRYSKWDKKLKYGKDRNWNKYDKYGKNDKYGMGMDKYGKYDKYGKWNKNLKYGDFQTKTRRFDDFGMYDRDWDRKYRKHKKMDLGSMDRMDRKKMKKKTRKWSPISDIGKTKRHWIIRTELPGVPKHKIRVEVRGKELIIEGKRSKKLHTHHKLGKGMETTERREGGGPGIIEKGKEAVKEALGKDTSKDTTTKTVGKDKLSKKDRKEKKEGKDLEKVKWLVKERGKKGKFKRRLMLPEKAHPERVEALYKDGVLEVLLPRKKHYVGEGGMEMEGHHHVPIH